MKIVQVIELIMGMQAAAYHVIRNESVATMWFWGAMFLIVMDIVYLHYSSESVTSKSNES